MESRHQRVNIACCSMPFYKMVTNSSKNIKDGYEVAYDSANFSVGTAMHRIGG